MHLPTLLEKIPNWVLLVVPFAALMSWHAFSVDERPVNPEVVETFNYIFAECAAEPHDEPTQRCEGVRYVAEYCSTRGRGLCSVDGVYETFQNLGYTLPPLRRSGGMASF